MRGEPTGTTSSDPLKSFFCFIISMRCSSPSFRHILNMATFLPSVVSTEKRPFLSKSQLPETGPSAFSPSYSSEAGKTADRLFCRCSDILDSYTSCDDTSLDIFVSKHGLHIVFLLLTPAYEQIKQKSQRITGLAVLAVLEQPSQKCAVGCLTTLSRDHLKEGWLVESLSQRDNVLVAVKGDNLF